MHRFVGYLNKTNVVTDQGNTRLFNYHNYRRFWLTKRALLCYLPAPIIEDMANKPVNRFSNSGIAISWARVLNELGFIVDIVPWDDTHFIPSDDYDLVVFHGGKNFNTILRALHNRPKIIHFCSGSYWRFSNQQEDKRREDFRQRHGVKIARDRYIYESEDPVNEAADGIIVLGDPTMRDTYPTSLKKVLTINNASFPDDHFDVTPKNYAIAKKNFLFFAGSGNIHKGLDLVVDAFQQLKDQHLFIMTVLDKQVLKALKKELARPNIHIVGEVGMRSPDFYKGMDQCAFVIAPSCSEGQAGSVVECMNQGLIPIVSKETRLDARDYGVVLNTNTIDEIQKTVRNLSNLHTQQVEMMSLKTRQIAMTDHSPAAFRRKLRKAVQSIIN